MVIEQLGRLTLELGPDRVVLVPQGVAVGTGVARRMAAPRAQQVRQANVARHGRLIAFPLLIEILDNRADERPMPAIARIELHRFADDRRAGDGISDAVNRVQMVQRTNDGQAVGQSCDLRQQLAYLRTGYASSNRLQLAANFLGGSRLRVERVVLT